MGSDWERRAVFESDILGLQCFFCPRFSSAYCI